MTELTNAELDAMERRSADATPAPWEASIEGRDHNTGGDSFIWIGDHDDDLQMYIVHSSPIGYPGIHKSPDADIDFIANARQDVPALISEIRRLGQPHNRAETDPSAPPSAGCEGLWGSLLAKVLTQRPGPRELIHPLCESKSP